MEQAVIFVLRHAGGWKLAIGDQRIGSYGSAQDASWAAMALALHLRNEHVDVELRLHDESGIRKLWPPALPEEASVVSADEASLREAIDWAVGAKGRARPSPRDLQSQAAR